tara:strand:- start:276 stop:1082 length:807 start_codon:yes stop_codon:yes gene_type:complete
MTIFLKIIIVFLSLNVQNIFGQIEIVILSSNVGTEIDEHENRFYRIFPKEKKIINAQFIKIGEERYRIDVVKKINGKINKVNRYINQNEFDKLKIHVDNQPVLTKELVTAMYEGMDFLRAEKIVNEIPKPQFIILRHSKNKKLSGTLLNVDKNTLFIQTATTIEKVPLDKIDRFSYRPELRDFDYLRSYTFFLTGLTGFAMASLYNAQRPVTYNENGIPRNDLSRYRQIFGTIIGLIFSSEVFDAISTLLTSTETIILSEAEYEKENY